MCSDSEEGSYLRLVDLCIRECGAKTSAMESRNARSDPARSGNSICRTNQIKTQTKQKQITNQITTNQIRQSETEMVVRQARNLKEALVRQGGAPPRAEEADGRLF